MITFFRSAGRLIGGVVVAVMVGAFPATAMAQSGACCLPTGHCVHTSESNCSAHHGVFHGSGVHCSTVQCDRPTGACCVPDHAGVLTCHELTFHDCRNLNGLFRGAGTDCHSHPCEMPTGACCIPDSSGGFDCQELTFRECRHAQGHYRGHGTDCLSHPCPEPRGACCLPNGRCVHLSEHDCAAHHGTFKGGPCSGAECPQPTGACCIPDHATGAFDCQELTFHDCRAQHGLFRGTGTECASEPCPPARGACCLPSGRCVLATEANCTSHGGTFKGGPCSAANCPQPTGACCIPDPATGGFSCQELTRHDCRAANGHYRGHGTECTPHACPPPRGACCVNNLCVMTFEQMCLNHHGSWQGGGVLCHPDPCGRAAGGGGDFPAALIADFNGDGRVDVDDAVAFIDAFALGKADITGDGTTDLEDFMLFIRAFSEAAR